MSRFNSATFSNADSLTICDAKHRRSIGVRVSGPYMHQGMNPPRACVEIERETITVNTETLVRLAVPADDWKHETRECTKLTIAELGSIITHLTEHRDRLKQSLFDPELF